MWDLWRVKEELMLPKIWRLFVKIIIILYKLEMLLFQKKGKYIFNGGIVYVLIIIHPKWVTDPQGPP